MALLCPHCKFEGTERSYGCNCCLAMLEALNDSEYWSGVHEQWKQEQRPAANPNDGQYE